MLNHMSSLKTMLYCILITSTIMAISSTNWLMIWMSLELNLFSFIPLLLGTNTMNETEASINYFLSQAVGSSMMLISSMMMFTYHWLMNVSWTILMFAILLKMGVAPCHYWFPTTMENTNWMNCLLLTTWQKLAPLFILTYIIMPKTSNPLMTIIAPTNALLGGILGLGQTSLKKIMAYSSITHMGWMLSGTITNMSCLSITYFIMYSIIVIPLFMFFNTTQSNELSDLWNKRNLSILETLFISVTLLSIGGLPPLTGFIPKLLLMNMLLSHNSMVLILLIVGSIMNLFFYLNIALSLTLNKQQNNNLKTKKNLSSTMILLAINLFGLMVVML